MSRTSVFGFGIYPDSGRVYIHKSIPKLLFYSQNEITNQACIKEVTKVMQIKKVPASCLLIRANTVCLWKCARTGAKLYQYYSPKYYPTL